MYWGQISIAAASAVGVTYYLSNNGFALIPAILIGVCTYIGARWVIAWLYRIRYWYERGTPGIYSQECPNCNAERYRQGGDWLLRCHKCGWKVGWPILRWATRSVPAIQLKRTIVGPQLLLIVLVVAVLASGATAGVGADDIDDMLNESLTEHEPSPSSTSSATTDTPTATIASASGSGTTGTAPENTNNGINRARIEKQVHKFVNEERQRRGLSKLNFDSSLREIAQYHSRDMAKSGYFAHVSPSGETMRDRYEQFGYSCRVEISGTRYATGAENIAYTFADGLVTTEDGTSDYNGNETQIARGLVTQWMNSPAHRKNILKPYWKNEGIGVYVAEIDSETRVYATQNFC